MERDCIAFYFAIISRLQLYVLIVCVIKKFLPDNHPSEDLSSRSPSVSFLPCGTAGTEEKLRKQNQKVINRDMIAGAYSDRPVPNQNGLMTDVKTN